MKGKHVELGSSLAAGNVAAADSFLMRRFRRAGLVTLGRTASPEFAYSTTTEPVLHGATRNPWDLTRTPGGSSGGSAAAVAAGITPIAHATDAAGSIRVPAASTGLFGLKPTRGRVSMGPDADEVFNGLAVHGALSRTVRDSATLLDLIQGPESGDPYVAAPPRRPYAEESTRDPGRLHIGLLTTPWNGRAVEPAVHEATLAGARLLDSLGHRVEPTGVHLGVSREEFVLCLGLLRADGPCRLRDRSGRGGLEIVSLHRRDVDRALRGVRPYLVDQARRFAESRSLWLQS